MVLFILVVLFFAVSTGLDDNQVVFVIISQGNKYNLQLAENLKEDLLLQCQTIQKENTKIYLSHKDFPHIGGWTLLPLIPKLSSIHANDNTSWIFFLEDVTRVRVEKLFEVLKKYNHNEDIWFGNALYDKEATIIHHFAFHENLSSFKYPNVASGVAMSITLLNRLSKIITDNTTTFPDFSIDKSHELALFIWNKGSGSELKHEPALNVGEESHLASFPSPFQECDRLVSNNAIYFAVKTCEKFHRSRIPIVKSTWAKDSAVIRFFSNIEDKSIPTINLGVQNTEQGHCAKTIAILNYIAEEFDNNISDTSWVVIADDDTILSVPRLQRLLSCYDHTEEVAIGERYGYNVVQTPPPGYNYITGGGGMVFSRPLVKKLAQRCQCPMPNSPDDMVLGSCMKRLNVEITHSPAFHQARPVDYASGYLESHQPVSFHKHWMIDPVRVYQDWFGKSHDHIKTKETSSYLHNEL